AMTSTSTSGEPGHCRQGSSDSSQTSSTVPHTKTPCAGRARRSGSTLLGVPSLRRAGTETLVRSIDIGLLAVGFGLVHIDLQDQEMAVALGMRQRLAQGAREA